MYCVLLGDRVVDLCVPPHPRVSEALHLWQLDTATCPRFPFYQPIQPIACAVIVSEEGEVDRVRTSGRRERSGSGS